MSKLKMSGAVVIALLGLAVPHVSYAGIDVTLDLSLGPVAVAPPPLPVYVVPPPPQVDLVWMPGYWFWDEDYGEYYWVPGTWVQPPAANLVWTPGYWGWRDGAFGWHQGYWGPHVGFYGGVNYGGGYDGHGFHGGAWRDNHYIVNRSVVNVTNITNVTNGVSFNGGPGGIAAAPNAQQQAYMHERHLPPTQNQIAHRNEAGSDHALFYDNNRGKPAIAATPRPADFRGAIPAREAVPLNPVKAQPDARVMPHPQPHAPNQPPHRQPAASAQPQHPVAPQRPIAPRPPQPPHHEGQPHPEGGQPHEDEHHEEGGHP